MQAFFIFSLKPSTSLGGYHLFCLLIFMSEECISCQKCCKWGNAVLSDVDIACISDYLSENSESFFYKFIDLEINEQFKINAIKRKVNGDCVFLTENGCGIYEVRPVKCRQFPRKEHIDDDLKIFCGMSKMINEKLERLDKEYQLVKLKLEQLTIRYSAGLHYGLNYKTNEYIVLDEISFKIISDFKAKGYFSYEDVISEYDVEHAEILDDAINLMKSFVSISQEIPDENNSINIEQDDILNAFSEMLVPASATIEITERCNEKCIHCYRPDYTNKDIEVWSPEIFDDVCRQLKDMGTLQIDFTGGEPFLKKDFMKYLEVANKYDFVITILTNGTLLSDKIVEKISTMKIRMMYVSLYSNDELIHDSITKNSGSFRKTLKALDMMFSKGIPICINSPIMSLNKDSVKGLSHMASYQYQADIKYTYKISNSYNSNKNTCNLNVYSAEEMAKYMADKNVALYKEVLNDEKRTQLNFRDRYCDTGFRSITISPIGDVIICTALREKCGNILVDKLGKIWSESVNINNWRNEHSQINSRCLSCKRLNYCEPCPAESFNSKNDIKSIDNNTCSFGHALYDAISLVKGNKN